jgi:hypothetical protein
LAWIKNISHAIRQQVAYRSSSTQFFFRLNPFTRPLDPVSRVLRIVLGVIMGLFSCLFLSAALWIAADMLTTNSLPAPGKSSGGIAAVVGGIGLITGLISWRLVRGPTSKHAVTALPTAFLQGFGWLVLAFVTFLFVKGERSIMMGGSIALAVVMITLGRRIAARRNAALVDNDQNNTSATQK